MGDALLLPFGLNLLSAAAFDVLSDRFRERVWPKRRAMTSAVSAYLHRETGLEVDPDVLEHVLFDQEVFKPLLRRDPGASNWDVLLFDLVPPGHKVRGRDVAESLYEALLTQGGLDVQAIILEGINDLKAGQVTIYEELLSVQKAVQESISARASESPEVHRSVSDHLSQVHDEIGKLTSEQLHVIRTLHGVRRALVPGAAGSGKTVVACEKALRLADAGLKTLLLCHNPWLALHLEKMTQGSMVDVYSFGDWVATVAGESQSGDEPWQRHDEPSEALLLAALARLAEGDAGWQAVIVDEGQDFRTNWWVLVDAAIEASTGLLYVFADDQQRVHGADRTYPGFDQTYTLSRNCRNSGSVYSTMRTLVRGLSSHERVLADLGTTTVVLCEPGHVQSDLGRATHELQGTDPDESVVILTMDGQVEPVRALHPRVIVDRPVNWRDAVSSATRRAVEEAKDHRWYVAGATDDEVLHQRLAELSGEVTPSDHDVRIVSSVAETLISRTPQLDWTGTSSPVRFQPDSQGLTITRVAPKYWHARVKYLASGDWIDDLPPIPSLELRPYSEPTPAHIGIAAVHTIPGFKGLEADSVVVVWEPSLSPDPLVELYVAVSRARLRCIIVAPGGDHSVLPRRLLDRADVIDLRSTGIGRAITGR